MVNFALLGGIGQGLQQGVKSFQQQQKTGLLAQQTLQKSKTTAAASAAATFKQKQDTEKLALQKEKFMFTKASSIVKNGLDQYTKFLSTGQVENANTVLDNLSQREELKEFPGLISTFPILKEAGVENVTLFTKAVSRMDAAIKNPEEVGELAEAIKDLTTASRNIGALENMSSILKRANNVIGFRDKEVDENINKQNRAKTDATNIQNLEIVNKDLENQREAKRILEGQGKNTTNNDNNIARLERRKTQLEGLTAGTRTDISQAATAQATAKLTTEQAEAGKSVLPPTAFEQRKTIAREGVPKPPSAAERKDIAESRASVDALDNLRSLFDEDFVGPLDAIVGTVKNFFGAATKKRAKFIAASAALKNRVIKEITGAQMSESEAKRILKQVPTVDNSAPKWAANWEETRKNLIFLERRKLEILGQSGLKVPGKAQEDVTFEQGGTSQTGDPVADAFLKKIRRK